MWLFSQGFGFGVNVLEKRFRKVLVKAGTPHMPHPRLHRYPSFRALGSTGTGTTPSQGIRVLWLQVYEWDRNILLWA